MKQDLLKKVAQKGYDISYAANLNFATYDIVNKLPEWIAFFSIVAGILGLGWSEFTAKPISIAVLIFSIVSIYIERFTPNINEYKNRGKNNTQMAYQLKNLYMKVKSIEIEKDEDLQKIEEVYEKIEIEFNKGSEPNQIVFAGWFAHYKLFCEKDVDWLDEQLHFELWKDKIPQSAKCCIIMVCLAVVIYYCCAVPLLNDFFKLIMCID